MCACVLMLLTKVMHGDLIFFLVSGQVVRHPCVHAVVCSWCFTALAQHCLHARVVPQPTAYAVDHQAPPSCHTSCASDWLPAADILAAECGSDW